MQQDTQPSVPATVREQVPVATPPAQTGPEALDLELLNQVSGGTDTTSAPNRTW